MLDLCRFKEVNDTLGHAVGDQVLCEVARRFREAIGADGYVARIGGDEFTVLVDGRNAGGDRDERAAARGLPAAGRSTSPAYRSKSASASASRATRRTRRSRRPCSSRRMSRCTSQSAAARPSSATTPRRTRITAPPGARQRTAGRHPNGALELHYQPQVNFRSGRAERSRRCCAGRIRHSGR